MLPRRCYLFHSQWEQRFSEIIRHTDAALLFADLSSPEMLEQVQAVLSFLQNSKIRLWGENTAEPLSEGTIGTETLSRFTSEDLAWLYVNVIIQL
jgi:hypothetical protein